VCHCQRAIFFFGALEVQVSAVMLMSALIRSEAWAFARSGKNNDLRAEKDAILSRACLAQAVSSGSSSESGDPYMYRFSTRPRGRYRALSEALKRPFCSA